MEGIGEVAGVEHLAAFFEMACGFHVVFALVGPACDGDLSGSVIARQTLLGVEGGEGGVFCDGQDGGFDEGELAVEAEVEQLGGGWR